jgi:hypothetical protein
MFNPISIKKDDYLELSTDTKMVKELYICKNVENFSDAQKSPACRYKLIREYDDREIYLEIKKDRAHNYQLFCYEKVEELDYNPTFLALLGSTTIGYVNPHIEDEDQVIYNIIPKKGEVVMPIKHIVTSDELPPNPREMGYNKDANENWYFMTNRSEGTVKKFDDSLQKRSWEYKNNQDRLLIEMNDGDNIYSNITIYEGKEIARRDLRKVEAKEVEMEMELELA